jgi:3-oxoacyl-[acyl-carrier protein] reductase
MRRMAGRLEGKTCIITGAARGIGRAVAVALSEEGAQVLVNDASSTGAAEVARAITEAGGRAVANHDPIGSVTSAEAILRTALEAFGDVDVLVNNAGILRDRMIHNMSEQDWDDVIAVHLKGTWACCRALVQHWRPLVKQEAREQRRTRKIINVTSASGLRGAAGQVNYAAAKMGVVGLTKTLAKEVGPLAINVNAVAPAALTAMTAPLLAEPDSARKRLERFALGRYGAPEEIAPAFVFLASPDSDYVTGQVLCIDGGLVI